MLCPAQAQTTTCRPLCLAHALGVPSFLRYPEPVQGSLLWLTPLLPCSSLFSRSPLPQAPALCAQGGVPCLPFLNASVPDPRSVWPGPHLSGCLCSRRSRDVIFQMTLVCADSLSRF